MRALRCAPWPAPAAATALRWPRLSAPTRRLLQQLPVAPAQLHLTASQERCRRVGLRGWVGHWDGRPGAAAAGAEAVAGLLGAHLLHDTLVQAIHMVVKCRATHTI